MSMERRGDMSEFDPDGKIIAMAALQHGVVSRAQLLAAGIPLSRIGRRVQSNHLRPLHRGVYVVGPLVLAQTHRMSAVLSCGESAALSHFTAGVHWEIHEHVGLSNDMDVTIPPGDRRRRAGIRIHRMALQPDEITCHDAIPVTTGARTLYDLARSMAGRDLERVVAEALSRRVTTIPGIEALVLRYAHRPSARRLNDLICDGQQPALSRSAAEESLLALICKGELPRPHANVRVRGHEVDFYWRDQRFVVEMDGFAFHGSRRRFESDRRRDAELAAAGMRVMRVTWRQLENEPEALLVRLTQALSRGV